MTCYIWYKIPMILVLDDNSEQVGLEMILIVNTERQIRTIQNRSISWLLPTGQKWPHKENHI